MQVKLLRVLQEKELMRVGGTEPVAVDVRILAASNRNIHEATREKEFRQDLYYRLNVVSLHIPPLSERRDDIPLLCQYFLKKYSALMKKDVREISPSVMGLLVNYDFPGQRPGAGEHHRARRGAGQRSYHRAGSSARRPQGSRHQDLQDAERADSRPSRSRRCPTSSGC